ncbi:hypothetical protein OBBRIDRAFT_376989 [Obba rivulosa]|uniref:Uncharacterized protein n=1 Tax=Obba rivulosa TaxID=1052685 RepID=A0A8E2DFC0_9APHY|nr:hypothetical protein OBBRIDRAFT_376989 [Obba rivulosa]
MAYEMASATPSAATQPSAQPGQQIGVKIIVKAVHVDPKPRRLRLESTVKLTLGNAIESKSFFWKSGVLRWNLDSPRCVWLCMGPEAVLRHILYYVISEILLGTPLKIHWTSRGSSKPPIEVTLRSEDLMEKRKGAVTNVYS